VTERPIAKYENSQLWLDRGFADYNKASRFDVWLMGMQMARSAELSEEYDRDSTYPRQKERECLEALAAHEVESEK
jgi:hypothetical protein